MIILLWVAFFGIVYGIVDYDYEDYGLYVYDVYHQSAMALMEGEPLYQGISGWVYLYPPLLAQTLIPIADTFSFLEPEQLILADMFMPPTLFAGLDWAEMVWFVLNCVILIGTLFMLRRYVPDRYGGVYWIAPVFFLPVFQALYIGQVTIIMFGLLAAVWVCAREDRPVLAGMLLALACWIKIYPGMLVLYFLFKRDWKVMRGVIVAGVALALLQIAISGPEVFFSFFSVLGNLTAEGQDTGIHENNSIMAFASRLFQENPKVIAMYVSDTLFTITRFGMTLGMLALAAYAVVRSAARTAPAAAQDWRFDLEYGLLMITILLFGSTLWNSGLPPMLLVYVLLLRNAEAFANPRRIRLLTFTSYCLISAHQIITIGFLENVQAPALVMSTGFFGVILMWGVMAALLVKNAEPVAAGNEGTQFAAV
jgi:hypothetical protein